MMSDGQHYVQTMLATQANHVVHDGKLVRGCIVRVKQYQPNNLKGKKYVNVAPEAETYSNTMQYSNYPRPSRYRIAGRTRKNR